MQGLRDNIGLAMLAITLMAFVAGSAWAISHAIYNSAKNAKEELSFDIQREAEAIKNDLRVIIIESAENIEDELRIEINNLQTEIGQDIIRIDTDIRDLREETENLHFDVQELSNKIAQIHDD